MSPKVKRAVGSDTRNDNPFTIAEIANYLAFIETMKAADSDPNFKFLEVVTPIGKKLGDCTGAECKKIGERYLTLSKLMLPIAAYQGETRGKRNGSRKRAEAAHV